ncbi:MAG: UDP-N-acetylmuramoyl-L-alanyl-D-glutamate--2,6-diaminopimelate ligase, partial [Alphaproteobacteria bacterium]|nr:UDP-N-acetylmuramoyl-L-alanyl-D-glutamate--2,6-diaminopimelate ligase [Alphaproteobacteria bacterium]
MADQSDSAILTGVSGLTADSRAVKPGYLFAALQGETSDGRRFIDRAVEAGAVAILTDRLPDDQAAGLAGRVRLWLDPNPRRRLAELAAAFFGRQPDWIALVTGTNGKTSTVEFARQIWAANGRPAASIGTLGITLPGGREGGSLTTPDPVSLARLLAQLAAGGIEHAAAEASSHGLEQERMSGVAARIGAFTSFSRDHLDYHKTERAYLDAKLRLFRERLPEGGAAVICADDGFSAQAVRVAKQRRLELWTYGRKGERIRLDRRTDTPEGQRLALTVDGEPFDVLLPLAGDFQAENALAALGIALASGVPRADAVAALATLQTVPGRLEPAGRHASGAAVYVDYAHTPGALEAALKALRGATRGRLVVVFGAGGDRDTGKRPEMGRMAASLADLAVVT